MQFLKDTFTRAKNALARKPTKPEDQLYGLLRDFSAQLRQKRKKYRNINTLLRHSSDTWARMVHEDLLSKNPEYKRLSDISDMQDTVIILLNFSKRDYDAWISENADAKTPNANNARYLMAHINEFKESMASATQRLDQSYSKAPQP